ncbi:MAG: membrane protein insertase YidC [candidate division WOR-3 bacterium]|nr:membrane protein insertase YidC [candidate division WOR-3 bacterium]
MNNNTKLLIMFVLVIGVFFFYSQFNTPAPPPEEPAVSAEDTIAPDSTEISEGRIADEVMEENITKTEIVSSDTSIIEFETDLIRGSISTLSGGFTDIILKEYRINGDSTLHIIPKGKPAMTISVKNDRGVFTCDNENYTVVYQGNINPLQREDSLVLQLETDSIIIRRTYIFRESSYLIGHRVTSNRPWNEVIYSIPAGINVTEENIKDDLGYFAVNAFSNENLIRKKHKETKDTIALTGDYEWMGLQSKYFFTGIIGNGSGFEAFGKEDGRIGAKFYIEDSRISFYTGPVDYEILSQYDNGMDKLVNFGWAWITPISKIILKILSGIYSIIPNYGFVIMLFAFLFILIFSPLTFKSYSSMRKMQMIQPKINELKKKYEKDPQKLNQETMKLYKDNNVNPFTGCLPLFIQMPVFFALYAILRTTIELRGAPFIFWIQDLSAKDPYFILPILTGLTMFVSQKFSATDNSQKMLIYTMPVIMTVFFLNFPSGIVIYWFTYNLLSIVQQYIIRKRINNQTAEAQNE